MTKDCSRRDPIIVVALAILSGFFAWWVLARPGFDGDLEFVWRGSRLLASGVNPYSITAIRGDTLYGGAPLFYPPPTLWLLLPLTRMPSALASGIVVALSTALLASVLVRGDRWRLGAFASGSFIVAASLGQWAPLLAVALLVPALGWLVVLKPSTGLAVFAARPSFRAAFVVAILLAISIILEPSWPRLYLAGVRGSTQHVAPVLAIWYGPVLLTALLRWRRPEARLLAGLACIPHMLFFYDELLLLVAVPQNKRELLLLRSFNIAGVLTWLLYCLARPVSYQLAARSFVVMSCYIPALIIVLKRPNQGTVPAWLDRALSRTVCSNQ